MSDARERLTEIAYRDEARAVYVRTDDLRAVLREFAALSAQDGAMGEKALDDLINQAAHVELGLACQRPDVSDATRELLRRLFDILPTIRSARDFLNRETKGAICPNTGLPCVPGCDRKTCGGLHIPLDKWPSEKGESDDA